MFHFVEIKQNNMAHCDTTDLTVCLFPKLPNMSGHDIPMIKITILTSSWHLEFSLALPSYVGIN